MMKYFKVITKCGHVGKKNYVPVAFAVEAESGKEAAKIARFLPRVKHDHKDAILDCKEVSYEEYLELREINLNDEYLKCHTKQQQNLIDISNRLVNDHHFYEVQNSIRHIPSKEDKEKRRQRIELKKKRENNRLFSQRMAGAY